MRYAPVIFPDLPVSDTGGGELFKTVNGSAHRESLAIIGGPEAKPLAIAVPS